MTGSLETSAITWGDTAADLRHPPQRPAEEDGGGDGGSRRRGVASGAGGLPHQPAGRGCPAEGGVDRAAAAGGGGERSAAVAAGVRQRGERDVPGAALPAEGSSPERRERRSCAAGGCTCRRRRERGSGITCERRWSRGCGATPRSGCRSGWRCGGRRPGWRCPGW